MGWYGILRFGLWVGFCGVACGMFEWFGLGSLVVLVVAFDFFVTYCLGLGLGDLRFGL